ncbi:MAG: hypothetical protein KKC68_05940 [Candidatus Thermoplasmatota archaeon]|nr:hypothetical protein [Candidatus Thermoplasmatota archaeon]MBU1941297.1 hypothetical protein [Candidatus Thermoplasmatota archaeon]
MAGKLTNFLREYVFTLSILLIILGLVLLILSILGLQNITLGGILTSITSLNLWNAYILVFGLIILAFGIYYQHSFQKNKRFILKELETNKRSELCKRHKEIHRRIKHLPSKYQKMLSDKEKELNIK